MTDKPDDVAAILARLHANPELLAAAERVARRPPMTEEQIIKGGVAFVMGDDTMILQLRAENTRLTAENAKLKGDAERYRWLRKGNRMLTITIEQWGKHRSTLHGEHADAAIDAAIGRDSAERDALLVQPVPDKQ